MLLIHVLPQATEDRVQKEAKYDEEHPVRRGAAGACGMRAWQCWLTRRAYEGHAVAVHGAGCGHAWLSEKVCSKHAGNRRC